MTTAALPLLWVPITVLAAFVQNIRSWFFNERSTPKELAGIALIVVGIVLLVLLG